MPAVAGRTVGLERCLRSVSLPSRPRALAPALEMDFHLIAKRGREAPAAIGLFTDTLLRHWRSDAGWPCVTSPRSPARP